MDSQANNAYLGWGKSTLESDDDIEHNHEEESQLMRETGRKPTDLPRQGRTLSPWVLHGIMMLVYVIALPYLILFGQGRQSCIDKLNAYCQFCDFRPHLY